MDPCMSARRRPADDGAKVDISGVFWGNKSQKRRNHGSIEDLP